MIRTPASLALIPLLATAACASDWRRSYDRWQRYQLNSASPYFKWSHCIGERSRHYLDAGWAPTEATDVPRGSRSQLFTHVLADCRSHMSGPAWENLTSRQVRRLIDDSWQAFKNVDAQIMAAREAEVI
jgi:hypothetical protein